MSGVDFNLSDIGEQLLAKIGSVLAEFNGIASKEMLSRANEEIKATYDALELAGKRQLAFEGCQITGGAAYVAIAFSEMRIMPITAFYPQARFLHDDREAVALGFFGEYDLYLQSQAGLPPTLLARYGDQGRDYSSFNPTFTKLADISEYRRHVFGEAVRRAKALSLIR